MWRHLLNGLVYILALCQLYRIWLYTGLALCKSIRSPAIHRATARARTVMMTRKRDHITPMLANLHWLPVTAHILFKIALLTFKTLTTHQRSYTDDLLQQHRSSRQLRSSGHNLLEIPRTRTGFAQRSFTYSAPHIWNTQPRDITGNLNVTANTFKK